ncbi:hypothetical protein PMNALOAF_2756 [Methylobacterium adhaesivum]|uniref:Uncharacterized protein n=1 Tax=Methylobacterium adhaesivum TaxID=333297 RepID=A0ABT8BK24_9HYPH|nr:hypothetical protein [Methylobacterium adhaesivum]MDN3592109.1 hypothetical protein [Methylobacterium adhaesivum]GJD31497.1 hypothetical protein PMNALOAF_2756 [Methylobacterium adhaesivum]
MTHPRKLLRHAIRNRLKTAVGGTYPTAADDKVFASRIAPIADDDYPAILIYTREEKDYSEPIDDSLAWRKATLSVVIEGLLRAGESVDDKLDDLAEQIEGALDGWSIPGFEGANMTLHETDIDLVTENVRKPVGAIGLTYAVTYRARKIVQAAGRIPNDVDAILNGYEPTPVIRAGKGPPLSSLPRLP